MSCIKTCLVALMISTLFMLSSCDTETGEPFEYIAGNKTADNQSVSDEPVKTVPVSESAAGEGKTAPEPQSESSVESFILAVVKEWASVQNMGDFTAYKSFYTKDFTGVKRSGSYEYFYDREGWFSDREGMFLEGFEVTISNPELERMEYEWKVVFNQHWCSDTYEDRGMKKLLIRKENSEYRIFREEMMNSVILSIK